MTSTTEAPAAEITGMKGALMKRMARRMVGQVPAPVAVFFSCRKAPSALSPSERFRLRLGRARSSLGGVIATIFRGGIDDDVWDEIEENLITADVGVEATTEIVGRLRQSRDQKASRACATSAEASSIRKWPVSRVTQAAPMRSARRRTSPGARKGPRVASITRPGC